MVKCESLRINMFRITHTGKSVNFPVTTIAIIYLFIKQYDQNILKHLDSLLLNCRSFCFFLNLPRTSIFPSFAMISSTTLFTDSSQLTSMHITTSASPSRSFPSSSREVFFSRFLMVAYTLKRFSASLAKWSAVWRPIPVEQPEIKTILGDAILINLWAKLSSDKNKLDPVSRVTGIPGWCWILGIKCSDQRYQHAQ